MRQVVSPHRTSPWDEDLAIISSENVHLGLETAGLASRFSAAVVDLLLQLSFLALISLVASWVSAYLPVAERWTMFLLYLGTAVYGLAAFFIFFGYPMMCEMATGQTPGKKWMSLRVMQINGMPVGVWPAVIRNVLRLVDFLPVCYGLGSLVVLLNSNNRRLGDLVAGTVVVRERYAEEERTISIGTAVQNYLEAVLAEPAATAPVTVSQRGGTADLELGEMIVQYLARRDKLSLQVRHRLAHQLVTRAVALHGLPAPSPSQEDVFLEQFVQRK